MRVNWGDVRQTAISVYCGGVIGTWLATTWSGFMEFPFREIGALLWPLLIVALAAGIG